MIVYAVYVITLEGKIVVSANFQATDNLPGKRLFGGLLQSLHGVASEIVGEDAEMQSFEIEGISYHIRSFSYFRIVLVTNFTEAPENLIEKLGMRFFKDYSEILAEASYADTIFNPFLEIIQDFVKKETKMDGSRSLKSIRFLDTGEVFSLPQHLQTTAMTMLTMELGTAEQVSAELGENNEQTTKNLNQLQNLGFIGKRVTNEGIIYFCAE